MLIFSVPDKLKSSNKYLVFSTQKAQRKDIGIVGRYESQIKTGASLDNQAAYAYTNLVKTAIELARNMNRWEKKEHDRPESAGDKAEDQDNDNAARSRRIWLSKAPPDC